MDFISTSAPPFPIRVDGVEYKVPRFLNKEFKEWAAQHQEKIRDDALSLLPTAEAKAHFRQYHQAPPLDIAWIGQQFTAPEGAEWLVREQLKKAGVPQERIDGLVDNTDPMIIRAFADELRSGNGMIAEHMKSSGDPGAGGNPQSGQSPTSGGSPEITDSTSPTGSGPTPEKTPTP